MKLSLCSKNDDTCMALSIKFEKGFSSLFKDKIK